MATHADGEGYCLECIRSAIAPLARRFGFTASAAEDLEGAFFSHIWRDGRCTLKAMGQPSGAGPCPAERLMHRAARNFCDCDPENDP